MSTTNPVFQVLVVKTSTSLAAAGTDPSALADGQIGIFSHVTHKALDASSDRGLSREFYFAVGKGTPGSKEQEIIRSAGQFIQRKYVTGETLRHWTAAVPQINFYAPNTAMKGGVEYGVKIMFQSNETTLSYGQNIPSKTFVLMPPVANALTGEADHTEYLKNLRDLINSDTEQLVLAEVWDPAANSGAGAVLNNAQITTWKGVGGNATKFLQLRLTFAAETTKGSTPINQNYFNARGYRGTVVPVVGDNIPTANFTITRGQALAYEEGSGYDINELLYEAGGWEGKPGPYRTNAVNGLAKNNMPDYVNPTDKFFQYDLTYDFYSVAGWQENLNNLRTTVCIPAGSANQTLITAFTTVMDAILNGQYTALADDASGSTNTGSQPTSAKTVDTEGEA